MLGRQTESRGKEECLRTSKTFTLPFTVLVAMTMGSCGMYRALRVTLVGEATCSPPRHD